MFASNYLGLHPFEQYPIGVLTQISETCFVFRRDHNVLYQVTRYGCQDAFYEIQSCNQTLKKLLSIKIEEMSLEEVRDFEEMIRARLQNTITFGN